MSKLIKYLTHRSAWQKLPMLPRMMSTDFTPGEVDRETETLMRLTHTRCPQGVKILMTRHKASSPRELIDVLPAPYRKRRIRKRFVRLLQSVLGLSAYDPVRSEYRRSQRR